jgi:hypothetical protein
MDVMKEHISTMEVRRRLGDILNRVHLRHDRFVIERKGTALAAVVPVETLEAMERLSREVLVDLLARSGRGVGTDSAALELADQAKHATREE